MRRLSSNIGNPFGSVALRIAASMALQAGRGAIDRRQPAFQHGHGQKIRTKGTPLHHPMEWSLGWKPCFFFHASRKPAEN